MTHARVKMLVAGAVLIGAVAYLGFAGVQKGWVYYLDVDAFLADSHAQQQRVRLCGRVGEEDFAVERVDLVARFVLLGPTQQVPVQYRGTVPDAFKVGVDVVIEGKLNDAGVFEADSLMTKCESKYQAEEHARRLESN